VLRVPLTPLMPSVGGPGPACVKGQSRPPRPSVDPPQRRVRFFANAVARVIGTGSASVTSEQLDRLIELAGKGELNPVIDRELLLAEAAEAHRLRGEGLCLQRPSPQCLNASMPQ
jgi:NADPH:quinone reductase-like Zn-dependent oxidoreductase